MRVFIYINLSKVSNQYHPEGGAVVVAESEARARELINQQDGAMLSAFEQPCLVLECVGTPAEAVFIFEDAGCC